MLNLGINMIENNISYCTKITRELKQHKYKILKQDKFK